jgi:REP element-mobilizing transposase RayT
MEEIGRKHPVHLDVHDRRDRPIIVYLTVCTKRCKPILANAAAHELLRASWREARSWLVGRYVVMPDHIHLFCAPALNYEGMGAVPSQTLEATSLGRHKRTPGPDSQGTSVLCGRPSISLEKWIVFWKSHSARHWCDKNDAPIWQRHFWDTQLRKSESYDQKWQYVLDNPVRAGLVKEASDWPYQGEMTKLRW